MKQHESGLRGEQLAEKWLAEKGMTPLDRRYRAERGEIDLVMRDGDTIVFIEVKYRPSGMSGSGFTAVTPDKQRRMLRASLAWLVEHDETDAPVRYDVLEITADGIGHAVNAFPFVR